MAITRRGAHDFCKGPWVPTVRCTRRGYMEMLRPALRAVVLSVLILSAASAVPCFGISKDFSQTYPLQPGGSFELQNVNGPVEVQGWERNEVEIHAVKSAKQKEADLDRVSIEVNARPAAVSVVTLYPQNEGVEVAVEYVVHVPYGARVEHIATVNGTLTVTGVEADRKSTRLNSS